MVIIMESLSVCIIAGDVSVANYSSQRVWSAIKNDAIMTCVSNSVNLRNPYRSK